MKKNLILLLSFMVSTMCIGQQKNWNQIAMESLDTFYEMLSLPNDANYPEQINNNLKWMQTHFEKKGFKAKTLETNYAPLLLLSRNADQTYKNAKTLLFYFHADGQPVDLDFWNQENAYVPELRKFDEESGFVDVPVEQLNARALNRDWRIFARSASDDKGPIAMMSTALDILKKEGQGLPYHLKIILDFEEEISSPGLPSAVENYIDDLKADALLIYDGPMHGSNQATITFGARGIAAMTVTVYGPKLPQHSGHYGNYAPNPAVRLAQLIASMKDVDGRVTIPGFYDGIEISQTLKKQLDLVPDNQQLINAKLGIAQAEKVGENYQESLQYPSLNVRGMASAWVGPEKRTIVPATATAEIDIRLVVESDGKTLVDLVHKHIKDLGYHILTENPTAQDRMKYPNLVKISSKVSYAAFRTDFDEPVGLWLRNAIRTEFGKAPILIRTMGGSIPIAPFISALKIPAVIVPTVNGDNNQHSPNENIRLGNYIDGIRTFYAILSTPY